MQTAKVLGSTRATTKHESLNGQRLVIIQPLMADKRSADGAPLIAIDRFGCRGGDLVMITSDSSLAHEITGNEHTPARWTVAGILDE